LYTSSAVKVDLVIFLDSEKKKNQFISAF